MTSHDALEIERKYDVTEATPLPDLHTLPGVRRVDQPVEHLLEAVYFDTDDLTLAANHITLRRRTGGDDAGWHLKLPQSSDTRRELHEPLGVDRNRVPEALLQRAEYSPYYRQIVAQAFRLAPPASLPAPSRPMSSAEYSRARKKISRAAFWPIWRASSAEP